MTSGLLSLRGYSLGVVSTPGTNIHLEELFMAKKYKRQSQRTTTTDSPETEIVSPTGSSRGIDRNFNPDYSYVIKDLKRIGMLAGFFFGVLIILSFFL